MNNRDYELIATIAKTKNLTIAAEKLYISQPALSYRLKNLEEELNCTLVYRTPKGVILTSKGEEVAKYAEKSLLEYSNIKNKLATMDDTLSGTIKLGVSPAYAKYKLTRVLSTFSAKFPNANIYIKTCLSSDAVKRLDANEVHVVIVRGDHAWDEEKVLINKEPIVLIANSKINLADLPKLPYIEYGTDIILEKEIRNWWTEHYDVPPMVNMNINDSDTCRQLVAAGLGFSILPSISLSKEEYPNLYLQALQHKDGSPLLRSTWIMYRTVASNILIVNKFIEHLRNGI
jgi:DNA-binding transcriptional LysR family regulator